MSSEWVDWHRKYAEDQSRSRRLQEVQTRIREALANQPAGPISVVSMCAGDGRDLVGALADHPRRGDVRARLVELTPELVEQGRAEVRQRGLAGVELVEGDASTSDAYAGAVPANLLLVCGVFGNISDADVRNTIDGLPTLAAPGATVIWTRGRFAPDLTGEIRDWFRAAGFAEVAFTAIPDSLASVGVHRLVGSPRTFVPGARFFTFLPYAERPSNRSRNTPAPAPERG